MRACDRVSNLSRDAVENLSVCRCSGLKVINKWPTFPQFIVKGEFIGGLDVVEAMVDNDEFGEIVRDIREA